MAASQAAAAAESSSRALQDAGKEPEPEPLRRRWVALVSTPVILAADDARGQAMPLSREFELDLRDPPQPSHLVLHPRVASLNPGHITRPTTAYILAADNLTGRLLLRVTRPEENDDTTYLCNAHTGRAAIIPAVPYARLGIAAKPSRSVGLVADPDPRRRGRHYLVVQLYPRDSAINGDRLLCYSTATMQWFLKPLLLSAGRTRNPCAETAVLAHAGRLYWLALAYGVFVCDDPFADRAPLRFVPLPAGLEMRAEHFPRKFVAQRRRVAPSEGHLRYVEIWGLSYDASNMVAVNPTVGMWTLVDDPDAAQPSWWRFEYHAPFAEVWAHPSYAAAGLPQGEVPHVGLVDPDDHGIVYFLLQGSSKLYGLDVRDRRVVSCEDCSVQDHREVELRNSRPIIDAWELSPPSPPRTEPSSPSPPPEEDPEDVARRERKDRRVIQYVQGWLETMVPTTDTDEGQGQGQGQGQSSSSE